MGEAIRRFVTVFVPAKTKELGEVGNWFLHQLVITDLVQFRTFNVCLYNNTVFYSVITQILCI